MGPLLESLIVIKWLEAIHPQLPSHVTQHCANWFQPLAPNFCDLQPRLSRDLDSLLEKLNAAQKQEVNSHSIYFIENK